MDTASIDKIHSKNREIQAKIDKRDRERMQLKPLDKHYGQRYFLYDRTQGTVCFCGSLAVLVSNGNPVCLEHIKGSLDASN